MQAENDDDLYEGQKKNHFFLKNESLVSGLLETLVDKSCNEVTMAIKICL